MSYLTQGGFTPEQTRALLDFSPQKVKELDLQRRIELALRHREIVAAEKSAFWDSVQAFALVVVPIATYLGFRWAKK